MKMEMKFAKIAVFLIALVVFSAGVYAQSNPIGPSSITRGDSQTATAPGGVQQEAEGGNVTGLLVSGTRASQRWQGFFGNVTGTIALDDAAGNSLYQWADDFPQGEIYAVNSSTAPAWSNVTCFNHTKSSTAQRLTLSALESNLGMSALDEDGVNETFNHTTKQPITIGSVTLTSDCKHVSLNVNDAYDAARFNETILIDNGTRHSVIYTAILEQSATGFQNHPADFEMIVGEDGDIVASTPYWFYVELS